MAKFSKYILADHLLPVNSNNEKAKADDKMFKKIVGDIITQLKADYRQRSVKNARWFYVFTSEQVEYIQNKLKESNIEIISQPTQDGFRIRLNEEKEYE